MQFAFCKHYVHAESLLGESLDETLDASMKPPHKSVPIY